MFAPLTQYRHATPVLILLSAGLVAVLALLGAAPPKVLCSLWVTAGVLSAGIRHIVARIRPDGGASVKAFAIAWPLLTSSLCFAVCHIPTCYSGDKVVWGIVQMLALLALLSLQTSLWQRRVAIIKHLLLGLIIGLTSTLNPHVLLWVVLQPIASYYMRCASMRNLMSTLTGIVLGIWAVYLAYFFGSGIEAADGMLAAYHRLFQIPVLPRLGTWGTAYLAYVGLLLSVYAMLGLAIDVGQTVRAEASIALVSVLSLVLLLLFALDAAHLSTHLPMLTTMLALQLTFRQANLRSAIIEWWILLIIAVGAALCLLPCFIAL